MQKGIAPSLATKSAGKLICVFATLRVKQDDGNVACIWVIQEKDRKGIGAIHIDLMKIWNENSSDSFPSSFYHFFANGYPTNKQYSKVRPARGSYYMSECKHITLDIHGHLLRFGIWTAKNVPSKHRSPQEVWLDVRVKMICHHMYFGITSACGVEVQTPHERKDLPLNMTKTTPKCKLRTAMSQLESQEISSWNPSLKDFHFEHIPSACTPLKINLSLLGTFCLFWDGRTVKNLASVDVWLLLVALVQGTVSSPKTNGQKPSKNGSVSKVLLGQWPGRNKGTLFVVIICILQLFRKYTWGGLWFESIFKTEWKWYSGSLTHTTPIQTKWL